MRIRILLEASLSVFLLEYPIEKQAPATGLALRLSSLSKDRTWTFLFRRRMHEEVERKDPTSKLEEIEEAINKSTTINVSGPSHSPNHPQCTQTREPTASLPLKPILTKMFPNQLINKTGTVYPTTLGAKKMLIMGFLALIGLLSVTFKINSHGNLEPTALFRQSAATFVTFLTIIILMFYLAAIGLVFEKNFPNITKVLNVITFVCMVLGVTVLLWALFPRSISWIPWVFFACTVIAVIGLLVYGRCTDKSSAHIEV